MDRASDINIAGVKRHLTQAMGELKNMEYSPGILNVAAAFTEAHQDIGRTIHRYTDFNQTTFNPWNAINYSMNNCIANDKNYLDALGGLGRLMDVSQNPELLKSLTEEPLIGGVRSILADLEETEKWVREVIDTEAFERADEETGLKKAYFYRALPLLYYLKEILNHITAHTESDFDLPAPLSEKAASDTTLKTALNHLSDNPPEIENLPPLLKIVIASDTRDYIDHIRELINPVLLPREKNGRSALHQEHTIFPTPSPAHIMRAVKGGIDLIIAEEGELLEAATKESEDKGFTTIPFSILKLRNELPGKISRAIRGKQEEKMNWESPTDSQ